MAQFNGRANEAITEEIYTAQASTSQQTRRSRRNTETAVQQTSTTQTIRRAHWTRVAQENGCRDFISRCFFIEKI